ncbi:MAG: hypothetical protein ABJ084_04980 [Halioglobus sp.]
MISAWTATAFNQVPNSENEIHGDSLAKEYGFVGGLVPGVTVSAYLVHPAVESWGLEWLTQGGAHVRVISPLYDGESFEVGILEQSTDVYSAELVRPDGIVSANAEVWLAASEMQASTRRGDSIVDVEHVAPVACVEHWAHLQQQGCHAVRYRWGDENAMHTYLRDDALMPVLLQDAGGGYANMSFILGISNWVLASNAYMNPWVHLETRSQNFAPIPLGTAVVAEMEVREFYEKKGHEFVDVDVALYDESDNTCLATIALRAIYKLRGS